jgi:hypothetical protein
MVYDQLTGIYELDYPYKNISYVTFKHKYAIPVCNLYILFTFGLSNDALNS